MPDLLPVLVALGASSRQAVLYAAPLATAAARRDIDSPARLAAWLAQVAHESVYFSAVEERLNYSVSRLMATWRKRFPTTASAAPYARNPSKLANHVYGGRLGNGDASTGDGYRFRGRGLLQVTGRANYAECGAALGIDLLSAPELLCEPGPAADSAAWYWQSRGLNELADAGTDESFAGITRAINGGLTGLPQRRILWMQARAALAAETT